MKKYLMSLAAIALVGSAFVSCSNNDFATQSQADIDKAKYDQAFLAYVGGKIASNQDWGFGVTRSGLTRGNGNAGVDYPATEAYHNMNHNEWADPDKEFGGWLVPDALTPGQKERVIAYFQANPNLGNKDPEWRHFFIQQVYKGGTNQAGESNENIEAANGSIYNSGNMNLLSVGQTNIHINDFNAGTCTVSNVLDNGQHVGGTSHEDQITLMVNIDDTSCFGYHETGSSTQHNNKWALVSAKTIDDWAALNGNPGEAVQDKWNRSFMGFDLALKEGAEAQSNVAVKYNDGPESYSYAKVNGEIVSINGDDNIIFGGKTVYYLTTETNMYVAADKKTISDGELQAEYRVDGQYMGKYINVDRIMELLNEGWLPVKDKNLREWVKVGKSDGYFTDWIVTLCEAQRIPDEYNLRIIAEDLSALEAGDFDFNDVVLDIKFGSPAKLRPMAEGGPLPLRINRDNDLEVHKLFGVAPDGFDPETYTEKLPMVNTGAGPEKNPVVFELTTGKKNIADALDAKDLPIEVFKNGEWLPLTAVKGEPASKIAVWDVNFQWLKERKSIKDEYPLFLDWCRDNSFTSQWW